MLRMQSHMIGRSSNEDLPLLAWVTESLKAGFFLGLEWSASWTFFVLARDETLVLTAAPKTHGLVLEAGESLPLPPPYPGFFRGDFDACTNALRRHIHKHVCPDYDGKPTLPVINYDHWFGPELRGARTP